MAQYKTLWRGDDESTNKLVVGTLKGSNRIIDQYGIAHAVNTSYTTFNIGLTDKYGDEIFVGDYLSRDDIDELRPDNTPWLIPYNAEDEDEIFMCRTWIDRAGKTHFDEKNVTAKTVKNLCIYSNVYSRPAHKMYRNTEED